MTVICDNGVEIKIEESQLYAKVTVDDKTWYWTKETGKFDGTSFRLKDNSIYAK